MVELSSVREQRATPIQANPTHFLQGLQCLSVAGAIRLRATDVTFRRRAVPG
jgi:hypothetical protein